MIGVKAGRLTVISRHGTDETGKATWACICNCGTPKVVAGVNLRSGNTKSCGCLRGDAAIENAIQRTTGAWRHPLYSIWGGVKARCFNEKYHKYAAYGGRGITLAPEWRDDFFAFVDGVGPRPGPSFSLDRIDNDGNYEPGNVRWATRSEQRSNTRHVGAMQLDLATLRAERDLWRQRALDLGWEPVD